MKILLGIILIYFFFRAFMGNIWKKLDGGPRTLLIDDMRNIDADVIARTFEEGVEALRNDGPFSTLYLDHDLGEEDPRKTGYDIMCFLEENQRYMPGQIIVVSSNPVGRQKMQVVIDRLYNGVER